MPQISGQDLTANTSFRGAVDGKTAKEGVRIAYRRESFRRIPLLDSRGSPLQDRNIRLNYKDSSQNECGGNILRIKDGFLIVPETFDGIHDFWLQGDGLLENKLTISPPDFPASIRVNVQPPVMTGRIVVPEDVPGEVDIRTRIEVRKSNHEDELGGWIDYLQFDRESLEFVSRRR